MDEVKIRLSAIKQRAHARPEINLEEFLSMGRTEGEFFVISRQKYGEVLKQYNSRVEASCCQTNVLPRQETTSSLKPATWKQKAKNASGAAKRIVKAWYDGDPIIEKSETARMRLETCKQCELFTGLTCTGCGCVNVLKGWLATEKGQCPLGKW